MTGGIHLDGYADTCDALASYGDREKKLEILKDPHCGAFAVIRLCSYFAAYLCLAACVQFTSRVGVLWTLALILERALSGLAVAAFPMAKKHRSCPHLCLCRRPHRCAQCTGGAGGAALRGAAGFRRRGTGSSCNFAVLVVSPCSCAAVGRHYRRSGRVVFAKDGAVDAGSAVRLPMGRAVMILITGPLYSGKRTLPAPCPAAALRMRSSLPPGAKTTLNLRNLRTNCPLMISCCPPRWAAVWCP